METTTLVDAARLVLTYIAPLIAAGALAKIGEEATDTSLTLLDQAWTMLTRRLQGHKKAAAGLGIFERFAYLRAQAPADARQIVYRGQPLPQEPLFYASRLDANIAVALRPGATGATLSSALAPQVRRLVELERARAPNETSAPAALQAERDRLLALLSSGA